MYLSVYSLRAGVRLSEHDGAGDEFLLRPQGGAHSAHPRRPIWGGGGHVPAHLLLPGNKIRKTKKKPEREGRL
jgi:hypothetical protein